MAMVMAKPRKGTPRMVPIISPEWSLSMGWRKIRSMSSPVLERREALMPAMVSARQLTRNRRVLLYAACRSTLLEIADVLTQGPLPTRADDGWRVPLREYSIAAGRRGTAGIRARSTRLRWIGRSGGRLV